MTTCGAELAGRGEPAPALRARARERGPALLAELRLRTVLVLAPGALHAGVSRQPELVEIGTVRRGYPPGVAWSRASPRVATSPRVSSVPGVLGRLIHTSWGHASGWGSPWGKRSGCAA